MILFHHPISHTINPIAQLTGIFLLLMPVFFSMNPWTPLFVLVLGGITLLFWLKPPLKLWFRAFRPFLYFVITLFTMNFLFTRPQANSHLYWDGRMIIISDYSCYRALSILSRTFVLTTFSAVTFISLNPLTFVNALMQQFKLPPRWGYAIYAGLNLIPTLLSDLNTMKQTLRIRRSNQKPQMKDYLMLPMMLLITAIRKAERIALAMIAREIENTAQRTFLVKSLWRKQDHLFLVHCGIVSLLILIFHV